jgi:hypothetical protein
MNTTVHRATVQHLRSQTEAGDRMYRRADFKLAAINSANAVPVGLTRRQGHFGLERCPTHPHLPRHRQLLIRSFLLI